MRDPDRVAARWNSETWWRAWDGARRSSTFADRPGGVPGLRRMRTRLRLPAPVAPKSSSP